MENATHSDLDKDWPPSQPAKGKVAEKIAYWVQWKNDQLFGFLRFWKPVLSMPKNGPVFITRFRDVQEVLRRSDDFGVVYAPMMDKSVGKFMLGHDASVYNERDKGIMRALIQKEDLPLVREMVARIATQCIEESEAGGAFEVVSNLSRKAPVLLTEKYFGFKGPDLETMYRWSRATQEDMFHNQTMSGQIHDNNIRAGREMHTYLSKVLIPKRKKQLKKNSDRDDIVTRLLKLKLPDEIKWDKERVLTNIMGLLVGGVETTSQAVVQILDQFLRHPKAMDGARQAALHDDLPRLSSYCWEALRFNPINPVVFRQCKNDCRIAAGTFRTAKIKKGQVVIVGTRSAMKDPREIKRPGKFDIDRPAYQYLHFGYGSHRCLGDHVSSVQIPEMVKALLLKKNLRRAPGSAGQIDFKGGPFPESFSVKFDD